jgi:hypothetical protein
MRQTLLAAAALLGLAVAPASAQVMYNGWNLGPDYGRMADQVEAQRRAQIARMQAEEQRIVAHGMQDPGCQALYRRHLAQGGRTPWPSFAFQCVATNRFDPAATRDFVANERRNQRAEGEAVAGLRQAERERGAAIGHWGTGYRERQAEAGRVMRGQSTWTDPRSGQTVVLPYLGGPVSRDPATGQFYGRDPQGRQYALGRDGMWYPLQQRF